MSGIFSHSINLIREIFNNRMVPLTIEGIEEGTKILSKKNKIYKF